MEGPPGRLLAVREAARLLRVSTATVYELCARGELAHVRVLNVIRVPVRGGEHTSGTAPGMRS